MDMPSRILDLERKLTSAGVRINDFCASVGIDRSTWTRWKAGKTEPKVSTWERILDAIPERVASGQVG